MITWFLNLLRPAAPYLLVIWVITIISVSSTPNIPTLKIHASGTEWRLDYLMHLCEYGFLAVMAYLTFVKNGERASVKKLLIITLALIVFAFTDEFHQKFIPGRTYNHMDLLSNFAGILTALGVSYRYLTGRC